MFTLLMWRNREAIKSRNTPGGGPEINHLEFIYSSYDPKYYFFGSVDMVRRLSLTSLLVLLWDQDMQIFTALFITIATVVCYREMAPYWYSSVDVLSYMCNWQLVLCILGLLFMDVKGEMKTNETFILFTFSVEILNENRFLFFATTVTTKMLTTTLTMAITTITTTIMTTTMCCSLWL